MNANTTLSSSSRSTGASRVMPSALSMVGWWMAMTRRWQIRRDERFLRSQPDHLLRDIGISRAEITAVVRGNAPR